MSEGDDRYNYYYCLKKPLGKNSQYIRSRKRRIPNNFCLENIIYNIHTRFVSLFIIALFLTLHCCSYMLVDNY